MTGRERRLAFVTALVIAGALVYTVFNRTMESLELLDQRVADLELQLELAQIRMVQRNAVEQAFADIAAEHSSAWSEQEIRDRLKEEIYTLSKATMSPVGMSTAAGGTLVDIPMLAGGVLNEGGEGYRIFETTFQVRPTGIGNLVRFLQRVQESPQVLRVESLELQRNPANAEVEAVITVSRTVIDFTTDDAVYAALMERSPVAVAAERNLSRNGSFEAYDAEAARFPEWDHVSCTVTPGSDLATDGAVCLDAKARAEWASVFQYQTLNSASTYDLLLDVTASGPGRLEVFDEDGGAYLATGPELRPDGKPRRYHLRFNVPGATGETRTLRAPYVTIQEIGGTVAVDNVILLEAGD